MKNHAVIVLVKESSRNFDGKILYTVSDILELPTAALAHAVKDVFSRRLLELNRLMVVLPGDPAYWVGQRINLGGSH